MLEKSVLDDTAQGTHPISPLDFFPFSVSAATIRNTNFIYPGVQFCNLGSQLGFQTKSTLLDGYLLYYFLPEDLIARFHVREIEVGQHIRKQCQGFIPHHVPEIEDTMRV